MKVKQIKLDAIFPEPIQLMLTMIKKFVYINLWYEFFATKIPCGRLKILC